MCELRTCLKRTIRALQFSDVGVDKIGRCVTKRREDRNNIEVPDRVMAQHCACLARRLSTYVYFAGEYRGDIMMKGYCRSFLRYEEVRIYASIRLVVRDVGAACSLTIQ